MNVRSPIRCNLDDGKTTGVLLSRPGTYVASKAAWRRCLFLSLRCNAVVFEGEAGRLGKTENLLKCWPRRSTGRLNTAQCYEAA